MANTEMGLLLRLRKADMYLWGSPALGFLVFEPKSGLRDLTRVAAGFRVLSQLCCSTINSAIKLQWAKGLLFHEARLM